MDLPRGQAAAVPAAPESRASLLGVGCSSLTPPLTRGIIGCLVFPVYKKENRAGGGGQAEMARWVPEPETTLDTDLLHPPELG